MATEVQSPVLSGHEKSADIDLNSTSLLYQALPGLIQRHVPKIRSLRSVYGYSRETKHNATVSDDSDDSRTPPPSYRTSLVMSDSETGDDEATTPIGVDVRSRPLSSGCGAPAEGQSPRSGIRWKFAKQGQALLSLSMQDAASPSQSADFSRQLYIDSVAYLLRGLLLELTAEEALRLRVALPTALQGFAESKSRDVVLVNEQSETSTTPAQPSVLHSIVAHITLSLFFVLSFLLPYIQMLLQQAYRYDRKHKISDRLLAQGIVAADSFGKQTCMLVNNVCAMNDGKVGVAVKEMGVWWMQGVSGGMYEGVGDGMQILGLRADGTMNRDRRVVEEKEG